MDSERTALRVEFNALRAGDPDAAAAATLDHIELTAENAIAALRRRGVIDGTAEPPFEIEGAALVKKIHERGGRR